VLTALLNKEVVVASIGLTYQDLFRLRWLRAHGKASPALVFTPYPAPEHSEDVPLPPGSFTLQPPAPLSHPGLGVAAVVGATTIDPLNLAFVDTTQTPPPSMPRLAPGTDPMPYLEPSLQKTAAGQDALLIKNVFNVKVRSAKKEDLGGRLAGYDNSANTVLLSVEGDKEEMIEALVHEMRHAAWRHLRVLADAHVNPAMTEEEYVAWEIIEEADTYAIEIEHEIHSRGGLGLSLSGPVHFLRHVYHQGYQEGVEALESTEASELEAAGRAAARKSLQAYIRDYVPFYSVNPLKFFREHKTTLLSRKITELPETLTLALQNHPRLQEITEELEGMVEQDLLPLAESIDISKIEAETESETESEYESEGGSETESEDESENESEYDSEEEE